MQCLLTDLEENLQARKKIQEKPWYRILGTEIFKNYGKTTQISEEKKLYSAR